VGLWEEHVVPRLVELTLRTREVSRYRERAMTGLGGSVVEIGFGSGLNVGHYPDAVSKVLAVDPSSVGQRLAATRLAATRVPVEFIGLDGQHLPLEDDSVDAALCTFTLCTIPDAVAAVREVHRVLRPGGTFHFLEHGLSSDPAIARWQHRLTPIQRRLAGGCHLDRPIDQLVERGGFGQLTFENETMRGPKVAEPFGYVYVGTATKGRG
jgi:ubiquinone/menaquinone biosynthesis C-methylase UbiE